MRNLLSYLAAVFVMFNINLNVGFAGPTNPVSMTLTAVPDKDVTKGTTIYITWTSSSTAGPMSHCTTPGDPNNLPTSNTTGLEIGQLYNSIEVSGTCYDTEGNSITKSVIFTAYDPPTTGLSITDLTPGYGDEITLSWAPTDATSCSGSYDINGVTGTITSTSSGSQTFTNVTQGGSANLNCTGYAGINNTVNDSINVTSPTEPVPAVPVISTPNGTVNIQNGVQYQVDWSAPLNTSYYVIDENNVESDRTSSYKNYTKTYNASGNNTYCYKVKACNGSNACSNFSNGTHCVEIQPPPAPTVVLNASDGDEYAASELAQFTALVSGATAVDDVKFYFTQDGETTEQFLSNGTYNSSDGYWHGSNQPSAGTYHVIARAFYHNNTLQQDSVSKLIYVYTRPGKPLDGSGNPVIAGPNETFDGSYNLSWGTASGTVTRYVLEESFNGSAFAVVQNGTGQSLNASNQSLGAYQYKAYACQSTICGQATDIKTVNVYTTPSVSITQPGNGSTHSLGTNLNVAVLTDGVPVSQVKVYFDGSNELGSLSDPENDGTFNGSFPLEGHPGTYTAHAQATYGGGTENSSTISINLTSPVTTPGAPTITGSNPGVSYTVSWDSVTNATRYYLQEKIDNGSWQLLPETTQLSDTFTSQPSGTYHYRVIACEGAICSEAGASQSVTVLTPPTVSITAPATGGIYDLGDTMNITVATSGTVVTGVDIYARGENDPVGSESILTTLSPGTPSTTFVGSHSIIGFPGVYVYFARAAYGVDQFVDSDPAHTATVNTTIDPLAAPQISGADPSQSYTVNWSSYPASLTYFYLYEDSGDGVWVIVYEGPNRSEVFTNQMYGVYTYAVVGCTDQTICSDMSASASVSVNVVTPSITMTTPIDGSALNVGLNDLIAEVSPLTNVASLGFFNRFQSDDPSVKNPFDNQNIVVENISSDTNRYTLNTDFVTGDYVLWAEVYDTNGALMTASNEVLVSVHEMNAGEALCTAANPQDCLSGITATNPANDSPVAETLIPLIGGGLDVGQNGTANYSIDIEVPPGIRGVQPMLSLNYNHQSGNGLLGHGWSLGGLSSITRCRRNWQQDGELTGINDGDEYALCLDGTRLIAQADGSYRLATGNQIKIVANGGSTKNPGYFTVYYSDGSQAEYGNSVDSYWEGVGRTDAFSWRINRTQDIFGNAMTFHYDERAVDGVFRIDHIKYGLGGDGLDLGLEVHFVMEARNDTHIAFNAGVRFAKDVRLDKIEMKIQGARVRYYDLNYQNNTLEPTQRSYMDKVLLCREGQIESDCQRTEFDWSAAVNHSTAGEVMDLNAAWTRNDTLIDVNQDGLVDIVKYALNSDNYYEISSILIAQKNGSNSIDYISGLWNVPPHRPTQYDFNFNQIMDVNGDGYPDLVSLMNNVYGPGVDETEANKRGLHFAFSNGKDGFDPVFEFNYNSNPNYSAYIESAGLFGLPVDEEVRAVELMDMNSDGLLDVIKSGDTYMPCNPNNAEGKDCVYGWNLRRDALAFYRLGQVTTFDPGMRYQYRLFDSHNGSNVSEGGVFRSADSDEPLWRGHQSYVDLNADGYLDIVKHGDPEPDNYNEADPIKVMFMSASMTDREYNGNWSVAPVAQSGINCRHRYTGDVNGDGLTDIVADCKPGHIVILNTGESAAAQSDWWDSSDNTSASDPDYYNQNSSKDTKQLMDMNADGLQDIVYWNQGSTHVYVQFSNGNGFDAPVQWTTQPIATDYLDCHSGGTSCRSNPPRFADFNGDGVMDVAPNYASGVSAKAYLGRAEERRIKHIRQYLGSSTSLDTTIHYENLTDAASEVYSPCSDARDCPVSAYQSPKTLVGDGAAREAINPMIKIPHAKWVVSGIERNNGIGGTNMNTYSYSGLRTDRLYGSLGFETKSVTNALGYKTMQYYSQDYQHHLVGSVVRSETFAPNGEMISEVESQYAVECLNGAAVDCFRSSDDILSGAAQGSAFATPHVRVSLLSQNSTKWTINSDNTTTKVSRSRMSVKEGDPLTCPQNDWNIDMSPVIFENNSRGNQDGYGRPVYQESIECDVINNGTYLLTTVYKAYEEHTVSDWLNGLETQTITSKSGHQNDNFTGGFNHVIATHTQASVAVYNQDAIGSNTPKGSLYANVSEAGTPQALTTFMLYNNRGEVVSQIQSYENTPEAAGGMQGETQLSTVYQITYSPGVGGYKQVGIMDPEGQTSTVQTEPVFGETKLSLDPAGVATFISIDDYGRPDINTMTAGSKTIYSYTAYKLCGSCTTAGNHAASYINSKTDGTSPVRIYSDLLGREVATRAFGLTGDPIWNFTEYDTYGRVLQSSLPWNENQGGLKKWTVFTYDTEGRVKTETAPDTGVKSNTYNGLSTVMSNALNQVQTNTNNALGWLIKAEDESTSIVTYRYTAQGLMDRTEMHGYDQASPVVTTLIYDNRGNRINLTDPNTGAWDYSYNALGLQFQQSNAGNIITINYDKVGRMVERFDNSVQSGDWAYNNKGQLSKVKIDNSSDASQNYLKQITYDAWGLPVSVDLTLEAAQYNTQTFYDSFNRVVGLAYPSLPNNAGRLVIETSYNNFGHADTIDNAVSGMAYWQATGLDELGNISQVLYGNAITTFYDFDPNSGRLLDVHSRDSVLSSILHQSFQYNLIGNLKQRTDHYYSNTEYFCYDDLNRLTFASSSTCADGNQGNAQFGYDSLGNITHKQSHNGEDKVYVYDGSNNAGPHAVSSISDNGVSRDYHYDNAGQMTNIVENSVTVASQQWTAFGKPWFMAKDGHYNEVVYNPERKRYKRIDSSSSGLTSTYYVNGIFEEVIPTSQAAQYRHYIGDVAVYTYSDDNTKTKLSYRHTDHLGSLIAETEQGVIGEPLAGEKIHRYRFDAWGKRIKANGDQLHPSDSGKTYNANKGYTGHEMLEETGLIHMNGRVYNPEIGRFLSPDPLVQAPDFTQSFNRYTYVWNNPLSLTDPTGYGAMGLKVKGGDKIGVNKKTGAVYLQRGGKTYKLLDSKGNQIKLGNKSTIVLAKSKSGGDAEKVNKPGYPGQKGEEKKNTDKDKDKTNNGLKAYDQIKDKLTEDENGNFTITGTVGYDKSEKGTAESFKENANGTYSVKSDDGKTLALTVSLTLTDGGKGGDFRIVNLSSLKKATGQSKRELIGGRDKGECYRACATMFGNFIFFRERKHTGGERSLHELLHLFKFLHPGENTKGGIKTSRGGVMTRDNKGSLNYQDLVDLRKVVP